MTALATVCHFMNDACRDKEVDKLRKQRHAANQRVYVMKQKLATMQMELALFLYIYKFLLRRFEESWLSFFFSVVHTASLEDCGVTGFEPRISGSGGRRLIH